MVQTEEHYLVFKDSAKAWKALHEIRNDSLAIGVHPYYKGKSGEAAEWICLVEAFSVRRR